MPDISMDNPAIAAGGLALLATRRGSGEVNRNGRFTGGNSAAALLAGGAGMWGAEHVGSRVQNLMGGSRVSNELAQALVGAGLSRYGGPIPRNRALATGIMMNVMSSGITAAAGSADEVIGGGFGGGSDGGESGGYSGGTASESVRPSPSTGGSTVRL